MAWPQSANTLFTQTYWKIYWTFLIFQQKSNCQICCQCFKIYCTNGDFEKLFHSIDVYLQYLIGVLQSVTISYVTADRNFQKSLGNKSRQITHSHNNNIIECSRRHYSSINCCSKYFVVEFKCCVQLTGSTGTRHRVVKVEVWTESVRNR